jgi:hypothetical protein
MKKISIFGFLLLAVALNSYANDSDQIDQLKKEIQEINLRLTKIESLLSNPSNAQEPETSEVGWKSVKKWRKLTNDMSTSDVQKYLVNLRVNGGNIATWYYQNDGMVTFMNGKLYNWMEPRK